MNFQDFLSTYILEKEGLYTSNWSMILANVMLWIATLYLITVLLELRKKRNSSELFKKMIGRIYYLTIVMIIRFMISIIDYTIWWRTAGELSLNGVFESTMWIFVLLANLKMMEDKTLIKIPTSRIKRYKNIILIFRIALIFAVIISFGNNFLIHNTQLELVSTASTVLIMPFLLTVYNSEAKDNSSKITKVRLKMIVYAWAMFGLYILTFIIGYGLMGALYPDWHVDGLVYAIVNFFMTITTLYMALFFVWSAIIPDWIRRRYNLITPKTIKRSI